jgi:hypothetical protein
MESLHKLHKGFLAAAEASVARQQASSSSSSSAESGDALLISFCFRLVKLLDNVDDEKQLSSVVGGLCSEALVRATAEVLVSGHPLLHHGVRLLQLLHCYSGDAFARYAELAGVRGALSGVLRSAAGNVPLQLLGVELVHDLLMGEGVGSGNAGRVVILGGSDRSVVGFHRRIVSILKESCSVNAHAREPQQQLVYGYIGQLCAACLYHMGCACKALRVALRREVEVKQIQRGDGGGNSNANWPVHWLMRTNYVEEKTQMHINSLWAVLDTLASADKSSS